MTTPMNISQILEAASQLSVEQQLALNKGLCELIKRNRRVQAAVTGTQFVPGMVVRFNAKSKGFKNIKIEKFNRAGTCVVGYEVHPETGLKQLPAVRWTVANTLCTKV